MVSIVALQTGTLEALSLGRPKPIDPERASFPPELMYLGDGRWAECPPDAARAHAEMVFEGYDEARRVGISDFVADLGNGHRRPPQQHFCLMHPFRSTKLRDCRAIDLLKKMTQL